MGGASFELEAFAWACASAFRLFRLDKHGLAMAPPPTENNKESLDAIRLCRRIELGCGVAQNEGPQRHGCLDRRLAGIASA